jgi:hypothetical protein
MIIFALSSQTTNFMHYGTNLASKHELILKWTISKEIIKLKFTNLTSTELISTHKKTVCDTKEK